MRVPANIQEGFAQMQKYWQQMSRAVNGGLTFGDGVRLDNIQGFWFNGSSPGTGNLIVTHNLGYAPAGALVFSGPSVTVISSTISTITLATTASTALRLFIV